METTIDVAPKPSEQNIVLLGSAGVYLSTGGTSPYWYPEVQTTDDHSSVEWNPVQ